MKVIIPVAGEGRRLRPHTLTRPKPLLPVAGRTILDYVIEPTTRLNPEEVIFVVGYLAEQIETYVSAEYKFRASYILQEELLGLGYALHLALETIEDGEVLIVLGDTIVECDLEAFCRAGQNVLGLCHVSDPERFGIVEIETEQVISVTEKPSAPKSDMAVIGLYYFADCRPLKRALAAHVRTGRKTRGEIQFTDALQQLIDEGEPFVPYEVHEWYDCGKRETLLATNRHLLKRFGRPSHRAGSLVSPPVAIAPSATIVNSEIGPNVSISGDCTVRDSVLVDCIVDSRTTIEKSVLNDSLIGRDVKIRGVRDQLDLGDAAVAGSFD